jgi:hypothetical protein
MTGAVKEFLWKDCLNIERMHSLKIKIDRNEEVVKYCVQYSYGFRMWYASEETCPHKELEKRILVKNPLLDISVLGCIATQVAMKKEQHVASLKIKQETINEYTAQLETETNPTKRFRIDRKRNRLIGSLENEEVFGGRLNLRSHTYHLNEYNRTGDLGHLWRQRQSLEKYHAQRILPYYFVGRANENGNRKFDFNFNENIVTFKPSKKEHIELRLHPKRVQRNQLIHLQQACDAGKIAVTVSLKEDCIVFTYDNEVLAGYAFNGPEYQRAMKALKEKHDYKNLSNEAKEELSPEFKALKRAYYLEQEKRQLANKIEDRVAAIDMNPEYIGLTIRDRGGILFTRCFDLSELLAATKGNNTNEIQGNLGVIYREIFKELKHYKVGYFFTEELEFDKTTNKPKSANRKNHNLWCRGFQEALTKKHCQNLGIIHREINAAYSSYVGNMVYNFFDPVAASAELARRGLVLLKKINETWYPETNEFRLDNLLELNSSVDSKPMYVPVTSSWDESERNKFRLLSVQSGLSQIISRNMRYRRLVKHGHISKLVKCKTFSGKPENVTI